MMNFLQIRKFTAFCFSAIAIFTTSFDRLYASPLLQNPSEKVPNRDFADESLQSMPDEQISSKIDSLITPLEQSNNYAGNVLVARGDEILFSQSYGKRDFGNDLNNDPQTRFFLCSGSMIFTSAAIMKLVDEGKLSLDDPLSKFLPDFKRGDEITIHHMLAQRSGIPGIGTAGGVRQAFLLNYTKKPQSAKDLVDYVRNYDLLFEPGKGYNHGKSEYNILAYIIEQVSGVRFGDYLQEAFFQPLGMNNTGHYGKDAGEIDHLAAGHAHKGFMDLEYAEKIHWSSKTGHASIYSTVVDLRKFGNAVLQREILSEESWNKIFTDYGSNWGYGWGVSPQQGHQRAQINGRSPGFSSYFGIYPTDNLIVIMLSNIYISLPYFVGPQIASIALGEEYETLNLSTDPVDTEYANAVTGSYKFKDFYRPGGTVKITFRDGKLYSDGNALIPVKKEEQVIKFIHRHYWSSLTFLKNVNGEYNQVQFDDYVGQRVRGGVGGLSNKQLFILAPGVVLLVFFAVLGIRRISTKRPAMNLR